MRFSALFATLLCIVPVAAQTPDPKAELSKRESTAKTADAMFAAASFAKDNGLTTDWRRLITRTLALDANHESANLAIGNVKFDGRWMAPLKAEILKNTRDGLVAVNGVWVPEAEAEDARLGVFHFAGETVTRAEYLGLRAGRKRHPRTGELIDAEHLEKAKNNLFPGGGEQWVDEAEANKLHRRVASPWVVRTKYCTVISNMELAQIEQIASQYVDGAFEFAAGAFGVELTPAQRPVVMLVGTADRFREVGNQIGGASSAYGGFLADGALDVPGLGVQRPAVALVEDPNWAGYYVKHAVGNAVAHSVGNGLLPGWMVAGLGAYAQCFHDRGIANWFGNRYLAAGGVNDLQGWFGSFGISGDMEYATIEHHLFQAGLCIAYCRHGSNAEARKTLDAVGAALRGGDAAAIRAAVGSLESSLATKRESLASYLKTLTQG